MRFRLTVAYLGSPFVGWQRQPNGPSVQEALEVALSGLAGARVMVVGAGRTDAGVHARGQVAHGELARPLPVAALVHGVNTRLPASVRVLEAAPAAPGFHAQRHAEAKEYRYRLARSRVVSPFEAPFVWPVPERIDLAAMREAAALLLGRHDFSAFALAGGSHRDAVRTILRVDWEEAGTELVLSVVGDGFLRGMVRGIVGTLVEVGLGRRPVAGMAGLLAGAARRDAGPTAPARGLCLERVFYPEAWGGPVREAPPERGEGPAVC